MIEYFILLLAIPLGIALAKTTSDEKPIYQKSKYFPTLLKSLTVLTAISIFLNKQTTLTLAFMLITTYTWHKT